MRSRNNSQLSSHSPAPGGCLESGIPFNLNDGTIIAYPEHNELLKRNAEFLAEYISQSTGHTLQTEALALGSEAPKGAITLGLDPAIGNREGYVLTVKADRVTLNGQTENGVFYGIQTLRKSIPAETKATSILLPAGSIQDEPASATGACTSMWAATSFPLSS